MVQVQQQNRVGDVSTSSNICPSCTLEGTNFTFTFTSTDGMDPFVEFTFVADEFFTINCPGEGQENVMFVTGSGQVQAGSEGIDPGTYTFSLFVDDANDIIDLELFDETNTRVFNTFNGVPVPLGVVITDCD